MRIGQSYQIRAIDWRHLLFVVQEFQTMSLIMHLCLSMSLIARNYQGTLIFIRKCCVDYHLGIGGG